MHNIIVKLNTDGSFYYSKTKWSGRPQKSTLRDDLTIRRIVMRSPVSSCKTFGILNLNRYGNKSQYCFETLQQGIWAQISQAGSETMPYTCNEKRDWTLPDDIVTGLSRCGRELFKVNRPYDTLDLARGTSGGHYVNALMRNIQQRE